MAIVVECCGFVAFFFFLGWEKVLNGLGQVQPPGGTEWRLRKMGLEEDRKPSILMGGIAWSAAPDNPGFRGVKT